ncbi:MAG: hypothetical protein JWM28_4349 [Chitinophagaceae bacterium]|nr:hypothetical protein [Chitinophagaceae bacterium]
MKYSVLFVCLLLQAMSCITQEIIKLDKTDKNGILLAKGWKFHAGDNLDWAKPALADNNWEDINPTIELHFLLPTCRAGNRPRIIVKL